MIEGLVWALARHKYKESEVAEVAKIINPPP
jgi:hypothetical protein